MYCTTVQQDGTCFCSCCGRCAPNPMHSPPLYCETYSYDGAGCVAQRCFSHAPALMSAKSLSRVAATCLPRRPMTKAQCDYQCSLTCPSMHDPTKCDCYMPVQVPAYWCGCCSAETCSNTFCAWLEDDLWPAGDGQERICSCSCCGTCHLNFLYEPDGKYCDTHGETPRPLQSALAVQGEGVRGRSGVQLPLPDALCLLCWTYPAVPSCSPSQTFCSFTCRLCSLQSTGLRRQLCNAVWLDIQLPRRLSLVHSTAEASAAPRQRVAVACCCRRTLAPGDTHRSQIS